MVVAENMCTDKHVQEHVDYPLMCHVTCLLTQHAMSTICNVLAYTQCHRKILRIEIQTQTENTHFDQLLSHWDRSSGTAWTLGWTVSAVHSTVRLVPWRTSMLLVSLAGPAK